ncbi:MAG: hypothetical protein GF344_20545 [Chitinivibrionales bacterium]|nr:hypothetical protein [Chitinivibrionales bacterium]
MRANTEYYFLPSVVEALEATGGLNGKARMEVNTYAERNTNNNAVGVPDVVEEPDSDETTP